MQKGNFERSCRINPICNFGGYFCVLLKLDLLFWLVLFGFGWYFLPTKTNYQPKILVGTHQNPNTRKKAKECVSRVSV